MKKNNFIITNEHKTERMSAIIKTRQGGPIISAEQNSGILLDKYSF
ncbi:MAG TPA: hypothetical protein VHJ38_03640 [Nitrososphaeraceae archaeon]|nr:hypothetical protein [Nitrososphaeraceae archaeon]